MKTRTTALLLAFLLVAFTAVPKAKADGDDHWGFNVILNSPGYVYHPYGWYYTPPPPPPPPPVIRYRTYYYPYHYYYRPYRYHHRYWRRDDDD
ncbi:MAG: hypothetical protein KGJ12_02625 [Gammaproteobacteria bacterium]|nr:hypothetical protein [Gammaproteobacteria bacterium]